MKNQTILDSIRCIIDYADEIKASGDTGEYAQGRLMGLCEALSILKTDFVGVEDVENLLDFDIDQKYLL